MSDDFDYYRNKRPEKTYITRAFTTPEQQNRLVRIASKVIDSEEAHQVIDELGERVIRVTPGGRQEIKAKFYEDNRKLLTLIIQRFTRRSGVPHKIHFSFSGEEITRLLEFITNLQLVELPNGQHLNVTDAQLKRLLLSPDQVRNLIIQNSQLVMQLAQSDLTESDLISIGYRREQLERFRKLLSDADYFESEKSAFGRGDEAVWQAFFEKNKWVFGYGLTYVSLASLDSRKLEQVVAGYDFSQEGKRADAVMKTRGAIQAICIVEIKKHTTELVAVKPYRPGCWPPSAELSGGVAQVQGTVEKLVRHLDEKIELYDADGNPTGETLFAYQPRSFLVVGSLNEFRSAAGANIEKYKSFELYRRSILRPEIITFDELYDRARLIVENVEG